MTLWARTWQALLAAAAGTFLLGLILLVWPHASLSVVAILIGIALLVVGGLRLIQGLTGDGESGARRTAYVIIGLLALLAGLFCLRHLSVTISLLAFVVGAFWVVNGVADVLVAASPAAWANRSLLAVAGLLSLIAGLLVIFWSPISLIVLVVVIGVWLILDGLLLAFLALWVHRQAGGGRAEPFAA